jgi:hypothetical protein
MHLLFGCSCSGELLGSHANDRVRQGKSLAERSIGNENKTGIWLEYNLSLQIYNSTLLQKHYFVPIFVAWEN